MKPPFLITVFTFCLIVSVSTQKTDEENQRRWHAICKKRAGGGLAYRQCITEQKELTESSQQPHVRKTSAVMLEGIQETRPNILLITTDQQKRDTLGCYQDDIKRSEIKEERDVSNSFASAELRGATFSFSPNIDKLASEGVRFTQAFTVSPSCTPSRTSILLSVHVPIHTVVENGLNNYNAKFIPFTDVLKASGYRTALFGKSGFMPLPSSLKKEDSLPSSWILEIERKHPHERRVKETSQFEFLETFLVNKTIEWISAQPTSGDKNEASPSSWFAYLSMLSPHGPNVVPTQWRDPWNSHTPDSDSEFSSSLPQLPPIDHDLEQDRLNIPDQTKLLLGLTNQQSRDQPSEIDAKRRRYYAQAAYVDDQVGRMIDFLDSYDRRVGKHTLVIFTTDHGSMLFDHGLGDKHTLHTEALHVPFIVRWKSVIKPASEAPFVSLLDLSTSILAAAQVDVIPAHYQGLDMFHTLEAHSCLQGTKPMKTHEGTSDTSGMMIRDARARECAVASDVFGYGVVTFRWKLWYYPATKQTALFDRLKDPREHVNLYQNDLDILNTHTMKADDSLGAKEPSMSVYMVQQQLLLALLRWRARQDDLVQIWSHILKGPKYVGSFTTNVFNYLENVSGVDSETDLQEDCANVELLTKQLNL